MQQAGGSAKVAFCGKLMSFAATKFSFTNSSLGDLRILCKFLNVTFDGKRISAFCPNQNLHGFGY